MAAYVDYSKAKIELNVIDTVERLKQQLSLELYQLRVRIHEREQLIEKRPLFIDEKQVKLITAELEVMAAEKLLLEERIAAIG
ncbi:hypothetical protein BZ429_00325 [Salmonella enterica subsp. enterica serovar Enteritidis]|jgi:hypothetical protein|nr:hypothetical protein [Enterobacter ludwigii]EAA4127309.1 hypothetical protein [Salmonella enterica subsp. enterica serovar Kentucky]EAB5867653.1 hypothetical protein [Salmonella enterica subsp. enterica serovar Cairina]EBV2009925.1 hypothetical protein [Salmonella enterica subsp. enterica serovar Chester]EBV2202077.1 hypothetical protein [Salmonella enterica subsp. enterica serovar Javiana]EBZ0546717.1 hypothetical protein [Salmonella enterica subsp. enterica serovar Agona]ECM9354985.1 hyp